MNSVDALMTLSRLKVQNVNTISSALTFGFPAMTAFLGFVHALERKLKQTHDENLKLLGVGIICHQFKPQVFHPSGTPDVVFCLTRNPIEKDGSSPPFAEEGRAHIEISLVIQVASDACIAEYQREQLKNTVRQIVPTLRIAGGSILTTTAELTERQVSIDVLESIDERDQKTGQNILRRLLPGFALISRENLLAEETAKLQSEHPQATALDALLEFASINFEPPNQEAGKMEWTIRKKPGWIVPIPVGYSAISELYQPGTVLNARDANYPFRFVENIYSLGQWLSPHRIKHINDIFWHYSINAENGLYRCINQPTNTLSTLI